MGNGRHRWEFMLLPEDTAEHMQKPETIETLMAPWKVGGAVEIGLAVYQFAAAGEKLATGPCLIGATPPI